MLTCIHVYACRRRGQLAISSLVERFSFAGIDDSNGSKRIDSFERKGSFEKFISFDTLHFWSCQVQRYVKNLTLRIYNLNVARSRPFRWDGSKYGDTRCVRKRYSTLSFLYDYINVLWSFMKYNYVIEIYISFIRDKKKLFRITEAL